MSRPTDAKSPLSANPSEVRVAPSAAQTSTRRSRAKWVAAAALVGGVAALPSAAHAQTQPWLADRKYTEGAGIKVGNFELHPGAAAEFGFDSNYFLRADSPDEDPVGALRLRITPSFSISTLGALRREGGDGGQPTVDFRAGIHATYEEFFPVTGSDAGKNEMKDQRNVDGALTFDLGILPGRPISGDIHGGVTRSVDPSNVGDTSRSYNRDTPSAGAEIAFTPNSGTFDWRIGYDFTGTFFESGTYANLDNLNHTISTRGRWKFLPRSSLMFDGRFGFITYTDSAATKKGSHPMRARLGFNGLITKAIGLTLLGGWGASFYEPAGQADFDSFIGQAEFRWLLTPSSAEPDQATLSLSSLAVGFIRDFQDSYIGSYAETDKGYAKFSYFFAGRFLLVLDFSASAVIFPAGVATSQPTGWVDPLIEASVFGEYRFAKMFGLNATVRYSNNLSKTVLSTSAAAPFEALQYQDFQGYLGFRWFM